MVVCGCVCMVLCGCVWRGVVCFREEGESVCVCTGELLWLCAVVCMVLCRVELFQSSTTSRTPFLEFEAM